MTIPQNIKKGKEYVGSEKVNDPSLNAMRFKEGA